MYFQFAGKSSRGEKEFCSYRCLINYSQFTINFKTVGHSLVSTQTQHAVHTLLSFNSNGFRRTRWWTPVSQHDRGWTRSASSFRLHGDSWSLNANKIILKWSYKVLIFSITGEGQETLGEGKCRGRGETGKWGDSWQTNYWKLGVSVLSNSLPFQIYHCSKAYNANNF